MKHFCAAAMLAAAGLCTPAFAATTVYSSASAFAAATTGVTTVNFEGQAAGTSTWLFAGGNTPYAFPGITISQTPNPPSGYWNAFRSDPAVTSYYYNWGTGDVINTPYGGTLTINFNAPVTAFAVDLGVFFDDGLTSTPAGAASTLYGKTLKISTSQGDFEVDTATTQTLTFFGLTSDAAFSSFSISGLSVVGGASTVLDNVRYGTAVAVPEPASWALMIGGLGFVGGAMRRRALRTTARFA